MLGCKLGTRLNVGSWLGWTDGTAEREGFTVGNKDGREDTLGKSDSINDGTPVLVGPVLGTRDGWLEIEGFANGCNVGSVDALGHIEGSSEGTADVFLDGVKDGLADTDGVCQGRSVNSKIMQPMND